MGGDGGGWGINLGPGLYSLKFAVNSSIPSDLFYLNIHIVIVL